MPHRPPCTKLSVSTSPWITILWSTTSHAASPTLQPTGPEPSLKNWNTSLFGAKCPLNQDLWNEQGIISNRVELLGAIRVMYVCASSPQSASTLQHSPKYYFHDDTAELAQLFAFRHHFKMMPTVFLCWIEDGSLNFITIKPQRVLSIFTLLLPLFFVLLSGWRKQRKTKNHGSVLESHWSIPQRKPVPKRRSLALVLKTEKLLTHPASCHHAKGSTKPPRHPSGGPLKHDRRQGWGDGGCVEKAKKKEAERSLQAVKCSQPQYIAYGLIFSRLMQHSQCTAEQLYRREPSSYSSGASNVYVFHSCLSAHFTSQPQSETLH